MGEARRIETELLENASRFAGVALSEVGGGLLADARLGLAGLPLVSETIGDGASRSV